MPYRVAKVRNLSLNKGFKIIHYFNRPLLEMSRHRAKRVNCVPYINRASILVSNYITKKTTFAFNILQLMYKEECIRASFSAFCYVNCHDRSADG